MGVLTPTLIAGVLFMLNNDQTFGGQKWELEDMKIMVESVDTITKFVKTLPDDFIEHFRKHGYKHDGENGAYLTPNVRNYLFEGKGNPKSEGAIMIFYFKERKSSAYADSSRGREAYKALAPLYLARGGTSSKDIKKFVKDFNNNRGRNDT